MAATDDEGTTYSIGLPVWITVLPDGSVTFEVDLSEADDLWEGAPTDDKGNQVLDDIEIERDILFVSAAAARLGHSFKTTTPEPTNPQ